MPLHPSPIRSDDFLFALVSSTTAAVALPLLSLLPLLLLGPLPQCDLATDEASIKRGSGSKAFVRRRSCSL
tara:strand:- start:8764 stop:8976 length:213 start_codon:yes stop_codon:yes gene_type:complete